jgi:hypothetical protein
MERWGLRVQPRSHMHTFGSVGEYEGKNSLDWKVLYTIGKLLKLGCLKWACMIHLNITTQVMAERKVENQSVNLTHDH